MFFSFSILARNVYNKKDNFGKITFLQTQLDYSKYYTGKKADKLLFNYESLSSFLN